jgi:short-subunit dehydrogenase
MGTFASTAGWFTSSKFKKGSVVVITGAGSGLGREIALTYAERGCPIVINARTQSDLDSLRDTCQGKFNNSRVKTFAGDVTNQETC